MRQRFEARKGTTTIVLWAENWYDALASFEFAFTGPDPTEGSAHRAASYDIVAAPETPLAVTEFLKSAGRKGGRPKTKNRRKKK